MKLTRFIPGLTALVLCVACQATAGGGDTVVTQDAEDLRSVVQRLESATEALQEIGELAEAERLAAVTDRVRAQLAGRDGEPRGDDLVVMRYAVKAYLEVDRHDAADRVERAMHAREMDLEERRDPEANRIREGRPSTGEQVELFVHAANLWDEWGHETKARELRGLAERLQEGELGAHERHREEAHGPGPDVVENQIEILLLAARGLSEVGEHDAVNRLELSIAARKARLQGHEADARELAKSQPTHEEEIELLVRAEDVYREGDMPDRADMVSAGTERYWVDERRIPADEEAARIEVLRQQMLEMEQRILQLRDELRRLDLEEQARRDGEDGAR